MGKDQSSPHHTAKARGAREGSPGLGGGCSQPQTPPFSLSASPFPWPLLKSPGSSVPRQNQEPVNPTGHRASSDPSTPCPITLRVPGAANTSRCFATTSVVPKIDLSYFKHFSLLFTAIVTRSRVKICYSLLCFPLGNTF